MASLCKVLLIGNLGADPEVRYLPNGDAVANLRIATSEQWKDKQTGEKKEATEWHSLTAFRRLAEIIGENCKKGTQIYVEGRLKTEKWQDKNGGDRYSTKVYVDTMKILSKRADGESAGGGAPRQARSAPVNQGGGSAPAPSSGGSFDDFEDDIPF